MTPAVSHLLLVSIYMYRMTVNRIAMWVCSGRTRSKSGRAMDGRIGVSRPACVIFISHWAVLAHWDRMISSHVGYVWSHAEQIIKDTALSIHIESSYGIMCV
jgi:hypothetical protein